MNRMDKADDLPVCGDHFNDAAIKKFIKKVGSANPCSYCLQLKKTAALHKVAECMEEGLNYLYADAAEWLPYDSAEGGYQGKHFDTYDILTDHLDVVEDCRVKTDLLSRCPIANGAIATLLETRRVSSWGMTGTHLRSTSNTRRAYHFFS